MTYLVEEKLGLIHNFWLLVNPPVKNTVLCLLQLYLNLILGNRFYDLFCVNWYMVFLPEFFVTFYLCNFIFSWAFCWSIFYLIIHYKHQQLGTITIRFKIQTKFVVKYEKVNDGNKTLEYFNRHYVHYTNQGAVILMHWN